MLDNCELNNPENPDETNDVCCSVPNAVSENHEDCCGVKEEEANIVKTCPNCGGDGKSIELLSIKSMLLPKALETLDVHQSYRFCSSDNCDVVYFGDHGAKFTTTDLRVSVFQKNSGEDVHACYCFGWTRSKIAEELRVMGQSTAVSLISAHIKAGRCGCEVNNPQGSCCLGNVTAAVKAAKQILG